MRIIDAEIIISAPALLSLTASMELHRNFSVVPRNKNQQQRSHTLSSPKSSVTKRFLPFTLFLRSFIPRHLYVISRKFRFTASDENNFFCFRCHQNLTTGWFCPLLFYSGPDAVSLSAASVLLTVLKVFSRWYIAGDRNDEQENWNGWGSEYCGKDTNGSDEFITVRRIAPPDGWTSTPFTSPGKGMNNRTVRVEQYGCIADVNFVNSGHLGNDANASFFVYGEFCHHFLTQGVFVIETILNYIVPLILCDFVSLW